MIMGKPFKNWKMPICLIQSEINRKENARNSTHNTPSTEEYGHFEESKNGERFTKEKG